jgi:hypothetical protein
METAFWRIATPVEQEPSTPSAYKPEADARFSVEAARGLRAGKSLMPKHWLAK